MRYVYKKLVKTGDDKGKKLGITPEELAFYFPEYLRVDVELKSGYAQFKFMEFILFLLATGVKTFLLPRKENPGSLDIKEVEKVYDREARLYDWKHHLTTRGMDTVWRRQAGYSVASYCQTNQQNYVKVLDLCTGTGLTIFEIAQILVDRKVKAKLTGLDYNNNMLEVARKRAYPFPGITTEFIKGDAMNLVDPESKDNDKEGNVILSTESFDCVTQMCGIGGIYDPKSVFEGALQALVPGGYFFLSDMHRPIVGLCGEVPVLHKWQKMPLFEVLAYESTTIPLVLNRLWGWRDTTIDFYILPLVTCRNNGKYWGYEIISFETESQRWWFSLPVMPYAKIIVKKEEITEEEYKKRNKLLDLLT